MMLQANSIRCSYPHAPIIWAIKAILQWLLCKVVSVGIGPEERDGFPPSPQSTLSQTWPLSPLELMLKWAYKENVLEQEEKTKKRALKTPEGRIKVLMCI